MLLIPLLALHLMSVCTGAIQISGDLYFPYTLLEVPLTTENGSTWYFRYHDVKDPNSIHVRIYNPSTMPMDISWDLVENEDLIKVSAVPTGVSARYPIIDYRYSLVFEQRYWNVLPASIVPLVIGILLGITLSHYILVPAFWNIIRSEMKLY